MFAIHGAHTIRTSGTIGDSIQGKITALGDARGDVLKPLMLQKCRTRFHQELYLPPLVGRVREREPV
jgi:hypothetical protein